jgi:hypothetical protein
MAKKTLAAVDVSPKKTADLASSGETVAFGPEAIEEVEEKVAEAAYYKAEKRGFAPGFEIEDWLEAEMEVKADFFGAGH